MTRDISERERTFDALYQEMDDPWAVETSAYERRKFSATLSALPTGRRFDNVLDIGCSFGTLTAKLAERSSRITAMDVSGEAIAKAQARHGDVAQFIRGELPGAWPTGTYDLIVLSEILYFLTSTEIAHLARLTDRDLLPNGVALLVNWTGPSDLPLSGDEAAAIFLDRFADLGGLRGSAATYEQFRIDVLHRPD